ncbi:hypothetical protein TRFO_10191 [Tritrichomonas foetus]|uniref:Lysosomal dipeptide transporter MFSD1 n=1 Tax=Tritrichomonas foetus TaxID=1144522 RepID=A0A1J4JA02_9EUKA|nr:hypothetical protein TRFO_10191 [Tritrichomonas foetus]|eukprot:OHS96018.1 hypothetical protein TRFO_10191 [Tritrichomonas foetus]
MEPTKENLEIPQNGTKFKIHRMFIMIFSLSLYTMVFFHRNSPAAMTNDLLDYFHVTKSDLSLISSMFLWSSALVQIIVAPFTDIFEPYLLYSFFTSVSIAGCLMCGFAKSFKLFVAGRFFIGIGIGPSYLAISKFTLGWFDTNKYLAILTGITLGVGGVGTFLCSFPLVYLEQRIGWRWIHYIAAIFSGVIITILFFIGRADPTKYGYYPVYGSKVSKVDPNTTILHVLKTAGKNFLEVIKVGQFWINVFINVTLPGLIMSFQSYWAGSWLMDVKGYSTTKMSNVCIAFTVGQIIPPIVAPFISSKIGHKRMVMSMIVVYLLMCIVFAAFNEKLPLGALVFLLFVNTTSMFSMSPSLTTIVINLVDNSVTATGLGIINTFAFVGSALAQMLSAEILKHEPQVVENVYSWQSYNNAIWYPSIAFMVISLIVYSFAIDPTKRPKKADTIVIDGEEHHDDKVIHEHHHTELKSEDDTDKSLSDQTDDEAHINEI